MQGLQRVGSASVVGSDLQVPWPAALTEPAKTKLPGRFGSSQQPKQSQPLGVSGAQIFLQSACWLLRRYSQSFWPLGTLAPGTFVLGS